MDSKTPLRANFKKYIKVADKWRFVPLLKQNGIPYPSTVLIDGVPTRSVSGTFYLEYYEDGRRVQRPVGSSPREAKDAWNRQANPGDEPEEEEPGEEAHPETVTVQEAFSRFLREVKASREPETWRAYSADLEWAAPKLKYRLVSRITRHDILEVMGQGRAEGLNPKTITRRLTVALMALRNAGAVIQMKRGDWPKVTNRAVEIYETGELRAFFRACSPEEKLLFQTFLASGFRKQEISTLTWNDVDFRRHVLRVRPRPQYGFKPKNHEEREVPVPRVLMRALAVRQKKHGASALVFPTRPHPTRPNYGGDSPDEHHLELCKEIAWRAGLNCRRCTNSSGKCARGPYCERWNLHKWRHTFATKMLQSSLDLKSLQILLGHKNLSTTEKYLKAMGISGLRTKINRSSIARLLA
jgi:integrase/recombinase XerD